LTTASRDATPETAVGSPLTERFLRGLGRNRRAWIVAWSAVPLVEWFIFTGAIRLSAQPFEEHEAMELLVTQVVLAYVVFVLLVGTGLLAFRARSVAGSVDVLLGQPVAPPLFQRISSTVGPLVITAVAAAVISIGGFVQYGPLPPLVAVPLLTLYLLPILTFVWVYIAILVDIDRLGRHQLRLEAFPEDRTLGLKEVGALASTGLGLLLFAAVPVMLVGVDEPVTLGISLVIVAVAVGVFILSMWRLHGQMSSAKARFVDRTQQLYANAYAPLRVEPTIAVMEKQASALRAADSLDQRAHGLPTWPIDESTSRFMVVIVTGVVTSLVVRGLFAATGA